MSDDNPERALSDFEDAALFYHRYPKPGKLEIQATKALGNQRDLALAYSPGVAAPCLAIQRDPATAAEYTARGNLVAVVSNGTAVLGLGNIGPLALRRSFPRASSANETPSRPRPAPLRCPPR